MKKIDLFHEVNPDIPESLNGYIAYFQDLLNQIPAEYRDNATIDIEAPYEYCVGYKVYYERPLTSREETYRSEQRQQQAMYHEAQDLRLYQELKARFENENN